MRFIAPALVLVFGTMSVTAFAEEPKPEQAEAPEVKEVAKPKEAKKICRSIQETGTRKTKRICLTKAEWKASR